MMLNMRTSATVLALIAAPAASNELPRSSGALKPPELRLQPGQVEVVRVREPTVDLHVGAPDVADGRALNEKTVAITAR